MVIDTSSLPTPLAKVGARLNVIGVDSFADTFLITSYVVETAIKTIGAAFYAALAEKAPDYGYRIGYDLVRADGLGTWDKVVRAATTLPQASYLGPEFQVALEWATRKRTRAEDDWYRASYDDAASVLKELGTEIELPRARSIRDLISTFIQIRNKTKAHGAVGQDFFATVNKRYVDAVTSFISHCPLYHWSWVHLSERPDKGNIRGVLLVGPEPRNMRNEELSGLVVKGSGIYFIPNLPGTTRKAYFCRALLRSDRECRTFWYPNGGYTDSGEADSIDYGGGTTQRKDYSEFLQPPTPLPQSDTHGSNTLDIHSNVFGNLPPLPNAYVQRKTLEDTLITRLFDKNHAIITLHGTGGVGKTYLALAVAFHIAHSASPHFESIVWFSGRDIDLRPSGPRTVKPAVLTINDISKKYADLFGGSGEAEDFALVLQTVPTGQTRGTLFIFDNLETMENVRDLHRFLDTYTYLPNKVLITSRERAFKADYPIEVRGMEKPEATRLLKSAAQDLGIEPILTNDVIDSIFDFTKGHAYIMRVVLGEIAKNGEHRPPNHIVSARIDIIDAIFERSFSKLTDDGRWVFLTVANWKSRSLLKKPRWHESKEWAAT